MTKRSTKHSLLMSALALLLCFSMLIGTTFAWFTDSVTSTGNIIKSGTLEVSLDWADGKTDPANTTWNDASTSKIFNYDKWEPGYTDVKHIKITNDGTLALKYVVTITAYDSFGAPVAPDAVNDLAEVIDVYYLDPAQKVADRNAFDALPADAKLGTLKDVLANLNSTATGSLEAGKSAEITLALKMQETAGNEYQGKSIGENFAVTLFATQMTYEEDSFDDQYDKDAYLPVVYNIDELKGAIENGESVKLGADMATATAIEVPAGANVVIDLDGKTLSGTAIKQRHTLVNNGTLAITGGTIASVGDDGGSAIVNKGTLTVTDATIKGAPFVGLGGVWFPSYAVNNSGTITITDSVIIAEHGGVASTGGEAILNNVTATTGKDGITNATLYTNGGKITVNGGTYTNRAIDQNATGASVINGDVTVNAGTFNGRIENYYGTPVIKGGTFSVEPRAAFVAAGYEVINNGNGTWTVDVVRVKNSDALVAAINNAQDGDTIYLAAGDYALRFTNNTDFNVDNLTISGVEGTNLAITSTEAMYGRIQGDNVTFENINFTPNTVGATGKATYNNCTFAGRLECASSGSAETYANGCTMTDVHTSSDMTAGNAYFKNCTMDYAAYGRPNNDVTITFENCTIGTVKPWNVNTTLINCNVTKLDLDDVTTADITVDGVKVN